MTRHGPPDTAHDRSWTGTARRLASFGIIGLLNTCVDVGLFVVLTTALGLRPLLANVVSFSTGAVSSFVLNGTFTFGLRGEKLASISRVGRFAVTTLITLSVSQAALAATLGLVPDLAAKLVSVVATFATGYALSSGFVYATTPERAAATAAPDPATDEHRSLATWEPVVMERKNAPHPSLEPTAADRRDGLAIPACLVAAILLLLVPAVVVAMPPLLDYPNHFARLWLIMGGADHAPTASMYEVAWTNAFTNIGLDLVAQAFKGLLSSDLLARLLLGLAVVLPPLGAIVLNRAVFSEWHPWQVFLPLLGFNMTLMAGFLNFQIGVGLALLFASAEPKLRGRAVLAACTRVACGMVLILTHMFPYCLYVLLVGAMALGPRWDALAGRTAAADALKRAGLAACSASVPLLAYVALTRLFPTATLPGTGGIVWQGFDLTERMGTILSPFRTYDFKVDVLFVAALAIPLLLAWAKGRIKAHAGLVCAALLLAVLSFVMPKIVNDTAWIEKRLPLMAVLVGLASLRPSWSFAGAARLVGVAGLAIVGLRVGWITWAWDRGAGDVAAVRLALSSLPRGASLFAVGLDVSPEERRLAPLARYLSPGAQQPVFWNYPTLAIVENGAFVRSLFATPGKQPIRFKPPYDVLRNERAPPALASLDQDWARVTARGDWRQRYDYLLVMNADIAGRAVMPAAPSSLQLVDDRGFARLYRIVKDSPQG